jgi:hypothetical protein
MIQNTMSSTNHKFVLHKANTKIFNWQVQKFDVPDINISTAKATSSPKVGSWEIAGTAISYDRLVVQFLLDEDLEAWIEIKEWIKEIVAPYDNQPTNLYGQAESTAAIHIMTNNHSPTGKVFTFNRLYPVRLKGPSYDVTVTDPTPLTCEVVFAYDTFDLEIAVGSAI